MQFLKLRKYNTKSGIMFFCAVFSFLLLNSIGVQAQKKYVVVLDAGHGGKDPGASSGKKIEKKIALNVVLQIGKELKKYKDIKVVYTRKKDVFIELHKRATIANKNDATLFLSIHCDSFKPRPAAYGASSYVLGLKGNATNLEIAKKENAVILLEDNYKQNYDYDPNSPESVIGLSVLQEENLDESLALASLIQSSFVKAKRKDRSVKQANFLVLRETVMPSILIELGFLTNKKEANFLNSKVGQAKLGKAIASAVKEYITRLKFNTVKEVKTPIRDVVTKIPTQKKETPKKTVAKKTVTNVPKKETPKKTVTKRTVANAPKKETPKKTITKKTVANVPKKETPKKTVTKNTVVNVPKKEVAAKTPIKKKTVKKAKPRIEFKVQIAASKRYISEKPYNFKGLKGIKMKRINGYYKYYYGGAADYQEIKEHLREAKNAGITDAFIVAFEGGIKISVKEAIKKQ